MEWKVIWSEFAEIQLDKIFEYYKNEVNIRIAFKLVREVINASEKLVKSPYIGQKEDRLKTRKSQYRYLVYKNYKLIYTVNEREGFIKIADVFDTRQRSSKIERTK